MARRPQACGIYVLYANIFNYLEKICGDAHKNLLLRFIFVEEYFMWDGLLVYNCLKAPRFDLKHERKGCLMLNMPFIIMRVQKKNTAAH